MARDGILSQSVSMLSQCKDNALHGVSLASSKFSELLSNCLAMIFADLGYDFMHATGVLVLALFDDCVERLFDVRQVLLLTVVVSMVHLRLLRQQSQVFTRDSRIRCRSAGVVPPHTP